MGEDLVASARLNVGSVTMPAGKYYVGDPCYAVPDSRWEEWLKAANFEDEGRFLVANIDGHAVLGIGTAYGDGTYEGNDGNSYPVDAGLLGLVPVSIAEPSFPDLPLVEFTSDFECSYDDGVVTLGRITIDTDPEEEDYR